MCCCKCCHCGYLGIVVQIHHTSSENYGLDGFRVFYRSVEMYLVIRYVQSPCNLQFHVADHLGISSHFVNDAAEPRGVVGLVGVGDI